jgi:hypothetical protein
MVTTSDVTRLSAFHFSTNPKKVLAEASPHPSILVTKVGLAGC